MLRCTFMSSRFLSENSLLCVCHFGIQGHYCAGICLHRNFYPFYLLVDPPHIPTPLGLVSDKTSESSFISAIPIHFVAHCSSSGHDQILPELPHLWQLWHSESWYWYSRSEYPKQAFTLLPNHADWVIWGTPRDSALFICWAFLAAVSYSLSNMYGIIEGEPELR